MLKLLLNLAHCQLHIDLDCGISAKIDIPGNAFAPYWSSGDSYLYFYRMMNGFDIQKVD